MSESKIKVRITAREAVSYDKIIEIPETEVQRYEDAIEHGADEEWFNQFADRWLDPANDVSDSDGYEDVTLTRL